MIVEPDFLTHWKTRALTVTLEFEAAPLCVLALWAHCHQRKTDRFEKIDPVIFASICRYPNPREAKRFYEAMVTCGFIELDGDTLIVHDFAETNAQLFANWRNGARGGRPKTQRKPTGNPKPDSVNPSKIDEKPAVNPNSNSVNPPETHIENGVTDREDREDREEERENARARDAPPNAVAYDEAKIDAIEVARFVYHKEITTWGLRKDYHLWLKRATPAPRERWTALLWLYRLPADDPVIQDSGLTFRRQTFDNFLEHLEAEYDKALIIQKQMEAGLGDVDPIV